MSMQAGRLGGSMSFQPRALMIRRARDWSTGGGSARRFAEKVGCCFVSGGVFVDGVRGEVGEPFVFRHGGFLDVWNAPLGAAPSVLPAGWRADVIVAPVSHQAFFVFPVHGRMPPFCFAPAAILLS